jgi:hypothetical protein
MLHVCLLRLLVPQDLDTYNKAAVAIAKKYFAINDIDDYYKKKDARPLIFCHFARGLSDKTYDEVGQPLQHSHQVYNWRHTTTLLSSLFISGFAPAR